jgi:hypothetical protein
MYGSKYAEYYDALHSACKNADLIISESNAYVARRGTRSLQKV